VAGSAGQRLFNDDSAELTAKPAEALFRTLRKLGDMDVSLSEVSNACTGIDAVQIIKISTDVEMESLGKESMIRDGRFSPWRSAQRRLMKARN
jgi:hypothetical protein